MKPEDTDKIDCIVWCGEDCLEGETVGDLLDSGCRWIHGHAHDGGPLAILKVKGSSRWYVLSLGYALDEGDPEFVKDMLTNFGEVELFENNTSCHEDCPVCGRDWRVPIGWVLAFEDSFVDIICDKCAEEYWPDQWEELQDKNASAEHRPFQDQSEDGDEEFDF